MISGSGSKPNGSPFSVRSNGQQRFRPFAILSGWGCAALVSILFLGNSPRPELPRAGAFADLSFATDFSLLLFSTEQDTLPRRRQLSQPSRRERAVQLKIGTTDTTSTRDITKTLLDSIRALPRDSSARLANFQHVRKDLPQVVLLAPKTSPMYLGAPSLVRTQHILDSLLWVYYISQTVVGKDVKVPLEIPLEEYSKLRLRSNIRKNWEVLAQSYTL
ncbi:MAG TPA: hypothetical protein VGB10_06785, partial [Bacteroidota bacterium]